MMENNVVSFLTDDTKAKKRKFQYKRHRPSLNYTSGSDGDVDSESDTVGKAVKKCGVT